jgi:hypothetical protein
MKKAYIQSIQTGSYLYPVIAGEHWVSTRQEAMTFDVDTTKSIEQNIPDIFYDNFPWQWIDATTLKPITLPEKHHYFSKSFFECIKKDFHQHDEHTLTDYLIYQQIKHKDAMKGISFFSKRMYLLQIRLKKIKISLLSDSVSCRVSPCFSSINDDQWAIIIGDLINAL